MQSGPPKLPEIPFTIFFGWKDSRKVSGKNRSQFHLEDKNGSPFFSFEIEHDLNKGYPRGGFSKWVKKGFSLASTHQFVVKRSTPKKKKDIALEYALRATVFAWVMGDIALPFVYENGVYLIMTLYEGETLSNKHRNGSDQLASMTVQHRLKYVADLLQQLTALHDLDCIHRDIKPGNIIIANNAAKLIDLDAVFMTGEAIYFESFTFPYLNRENQQLFLKTRASLNAGEFFTKKTDIYALGISLCVLFPDLFDLFNYPPLLIDTDHTVVSTATKTESARLSHNPLASFIISLLKSDCQYGSAREVLTEFVRLCQLEYQKDFSAALAPTNRMTREMVKAALDRMMPLCKNLDSVHASYTESSGYLKRRLSQPKALITRDVLSSEAMKKSLLEIDPVNYPQVFLNIENSPLKAESLIELYQQTLVSLPAARKYAFLCACLPQLLRKVTVSATMILDFFRYSLYSLREVEPSIGDICELIKIVKLNHHYLIIEMMKKFIPIITRREEDIRTVFDLLSTHSRCAIYQLCHSMFDLTPQVKIMWLKPLSTSQIVCALASELRSEKFHATPADIILLYLRSNLIGLDAMSYPSLVSVLAKLSDQEFDLILSEISRKYPIGNYLNGYVLDFMSALSKANSLAAMRVFYRYLLPYTLKLSQVITKAQVDLLEQCLQPHSREDQFAMVCFFGQMSHFPAVMRSMQRQPVSSSDRVSIALEINAAVCVQFYDLYLSAYDLRADNVMPLISRLGVSDRLPFLLKHATKIKTLTSGMSEDVAALFYAKCLEMTDYVHTNNLTALVSMLPTAHRAPFILRHANLISVNVDIRPMTNYLDDATCNFLMARQQIMKRLNGYASDKVNIHDRRVDFIIDKVSHAQSVSELEAIINGNSFEAVPGQRHQFEDRVPTHKLFSYGFSDLLKSCLTVLEELPRPSKKEQEFGFHFL
jgi:serine/threonine protein kinase